MPTQRVVLSAAPFRRCCVPALHRTHAPLPISPSFSAQMGWTPLHHAAENGREEVARALLEKGAATEAEGRVRKTTWPFTANPLPLCLRMCACLTLLMACGCCVMRRCFGGGLRGDISLLIVGVGRRSMESQIGTSQSRAREVESQGLTDELEF